jgi:hypothetical protein
MKRVAKMVQKIKKKEISQTDRKQLLKMRTMKNAIHYSLTLKWTMFVKHLKNSFKFVKNVITI